MGLFDFLKPIRQGSAHPRELEEKMKMIGLVAFPGGPQQINSEAPQLQALFRNRIGLDEAKHIISRAKALLVIADGESANCVVPGIVSYSNGKITQEDATLTCQLMRPSMSGHVAAGRPILPAARLTVFSPPCQQPSKTVTL